MPFPENHDEFDIGSDWALYYLHQSEEFPLGEIGNPETKPDKDRALVESVLGNEMGPIIHMALAPHPKHNIVEMLAEVPAEHQTVVADGLIIPKDRRFAAETFVGDCPVIVVDSSQWLGMIHAGRPEVVDGVIEQFFARWPGMAVSDPTSIFIGPGISGGFYELPQIPEGFEHYKTTTIWGTQGFDVLAAIEDQIEKFSFLSRVDFVYAGTDPFAEHRVGHNQWASNEWYKRQSAATGVKRCSPRDCALLAYQPAE